MYVPCHPLVSMITFIIKYPIVKEVADSLDSGRRSTKPSNIAHKEIKLESLLTRMHSSRMRTGHSLTVCRSLLPGGGTECLVWGGVWSGGVGVCSRGHVWSGGSLVWGCLVWGVSGPRGVSGPEGVWSQGVSALGGLLQGGVCSRGGVYSGECGIPACTEADTPLPLWTESQTPVKTLPWPNFVAAGNNKMTAMAHHSMH